MPNPPPRALPAKAEGARAGGGYRVAGVVFALAWLVLCWPWLSGRVTVPWDAKAHFYPQFAFLARALSTGDGLAWTPNVFDGWPQIADPQSLIFAPAYFLAALLGPVPSFQLADGVLFGSLALGALGVMLYFRDRGWRAEGALLAALAFAFGGSAAWRIQHVGQVLSLSWSPLAFFALARALDRGSARWGAAAGLFAGFMVLGRDQIAWFYVLIFAAFVIFRTLAAPGLRLNLRRFMRPLGAGAVAGLIVVAAPLALTLALAADSNRPSIVYSEVVKASLHPAAFLTLVVPNLFGVDGPLAEFWGPPSQAWGVTDLFLARNMGEVYIGALALVALVAGGLSPRGADRDVKFLSAAALVLILYALGRYTPGFAVLYHLPGADLWRRPADATFPICALLAYLAGYAVHRLASGEIRWRPAGIAAVLAILLGGCCAVAVWKHQLAKASGPLLMAAVFLAASALLVGWLARRRASASALALVLIGALSAADFALGTGPNESTALPPADFEMLQPNSNNSTIALLREKLAGAAPDRRDRVELAGLGFAWPNASLVHDFDHDLGYNPLRLSLFERFTHAGDTIGLPEQREFSAAFPSYRSIAADLTGLRWIATGVPISRIDPNLKPGDLNFVARTADAYIYENPRAFPRVFVASSARSADFDAILATGVWPKVDYRSTILLRAGDDNLPRRAGTARILSYRNTQVEIAAEAPDGGWLFLGDAYHPWWDCTVDGVPAEIFQADVLFRAVWLNPGAHRVRFVFRPLTGLWRQMAAGLARRAANP